MKDKTRVVINLLYALIVSFVLIVLTIFAPDVFPEIQGRQFLIFLFGFGGTFMILGFILGIFARKWVKNKKFKTFLMLAGFSAGSFLILTVLHNVFYGVAEAFNDIVIVRYVAEALSVVSFIVSLIVVPVAFLVGVVGSLVIHFKGGVDKVDEG